jgi:protein-tyrosine kinase
MTVNKIQKALDKARILSNPEAKRRGLWSHGAPDVAYLPGEDLNGERTPEETLLDKLALTERKIIYSEMQDSRTLNIFRDLGTRLLQREARTNFAVMISSVVPDGGGSFVAMNYAAALGLITGKALLIDCNIPTPDAVQGLAPAADFGLFDYLDREDLNPSDIVYRTGVFGLQLVPALGRMSVLLSEFKQRKREFYVVLDAPTATTQLADIRVLSQLCDYSILVVPYGTADETQIQTASEAIAKEKLLGVIFNEGQIPG